MPFGDFEENWIDRRRLRNKCFCQGLFLGAVVVAQLVERLPPTPEICDSNPVIGKLLSNICLLSTVLKRQK